MNKPTTLFCSMACLLLASLEVSSQKVTDAVFIKNGEEEGVGILRQRENEVYVLCPSHIVPKTTFYPIEITTVSGSSYKAEYKTSEGNVSILQITDRRT